MLLTLDALYDKAIRLLATAAETGDREIPLGEPGEIIVCGPQVMPSYLNDTYIHALEVQLNRRF